MSLLWSADDDVALLSENFSGLFPCSDSDCGSAEGSSGRVPNGTFREHKSVRKLRKYENTVASRRSKRRSEHERRRARLAVRGSQAVQLPLLLEVHIDFGFTERMSGKELSRLVRQMGRVWSLQKRFVGLQVTLQSPCEKFLAEGRRVLTGFDAFQWKIANGAFVPENSVRRMVYLSPDADLQPLLDISSDTMYVIGGLVDETGVGPLSRDVAERLDIELCRLPITEFMKRKEKGTYNVMLTINQVVEILARYAATRQWAEALSAVLPQRIGYEPKDC